jgi:transcription elongation factor Elf1
VQKEDVKTRCLRCGELSLVEFYNEKTGDAIVFKCESCGKRFLELTA